MLRAALVRLAARAAGLGGGMGVFLSGPIIAELGAASQAADPLASGRRILEVVVPLCYRPALKAAFLQLECGGALARLLAAIASPDAAAAHMLASRADEAQSVATMVLEAATVLISPNVCLDPSASVDRRSVTDTPPLPEMASLVAVVLGCLPRLGACAHLAGRLLRVGAAGRAGRAAVAAGAARWRAVCLGPSAEAVDATGALQWAAARLWQHLDQEVGEAPSLQAIRQEVAKVMQAAASAADDDGDAAERDISDYAPPPADVRFAAAVQASVAAAAEDPSAASEADDAHSAHSPLQVVHDPATRTFWRNVSARHTASSASHPLGCAAPVVWEVLASAAPSPYGQHLAGGLTPPRRPRSDHLASFVASKARNGSLPGGASAAAKIAAGKAAAEASAAAAALALQAAPGADMPPVIAPSRSGRQRGSSNRPSSMHVDDFERQKGSGPPTNKNITSLAKSNSGSSGGKSMSASKQPPVATTAAHSASTVAAAAKKALPSKAATPAAAATGAAAQSAKAAGSGSSSAAPSANPLANPKAAAELFKDPARLQKLLQDNPALISVLKTRLGMS